MLRNLFVAAFSLCLVCSAFAQTVPDQPTIYILFLTQHAAVAADGRASDLNRAAALHLTVADLRVVDSVAAEFMRRDEILRTEARKYHRGVSALNRRQDPQIVHSFTVRRNALAMSAFTELQARMPPSEFGALQRYLSEDFNKSISVLR